MTRFFRPGMQISEIHVKLVSMSSSKFSDSIIKFRYLAFREVQTILLFTGKFYEF